MFVQIVVPLAKPMRVIDPASAIVVTVIDEQWVVAVPEMMVMSVRAEPTVVAVVVTKVVVTVARSDPQMIERS